MIKIPLFRPCHDHREEEAVAQVLRSGWTGLGPLVEEFEGKFAKYVGSRYAVAVNSCTEALRLAMVMAGVGGKKVIVPAITFCSTAHAAIQAGASVVFADVYADNLMLSVGDVREKREGDVALVVPVLYAGQTPDPKWEGLGTPLVYDCAHACGAKFNAGGKVCCWSFHSVKNLSCGDGGMITLDDPEKTEWLKRMRWMGITRSTYQRSGGGMYQWYYDVPELGGKCHMNDITAAIGLAQLGKMEEMQASRREMAALYRRMLEEAARRCEWAFSQIAYDPMGSHHLIVIYCGRDRDRLSDYLAGRGIATGVHYKPLPLHSCYGGREGEAPRAERVWKHILSLPMYPGITKEEVEEVCDAIQSFYS